MQEEGWVESYVVKINSYCSYKWVLSSSTAKLAQNPRRMSDSRSQPRQHASPSASRFRLSCMRGVQSDVNCCWCKGRPEARETARCWLAHSQEARPAARTPDRRNARISDGELSREAEVAKKTTKWRGSAGTRPSGQPPRLVRVAFDEDVLRRSNSCGAVTNLPMTAATTAIHASSMVIPVIAWPSLPAVPACTFPEGSAAQWVLTETSECLLSE